MLNVSSTELNPVLESMQREKRTVALNSLLAAIAITFLKVIVGISTRSLGILSEAAHSGLDLVAALVTLLSVRVSDKPAMPSTSTVTAKWKTFLLSLRPVCFCSPASGSSGKRCGVLTDITACTLSLQLPPL